MKKFNSLFTRLNEDMTSAGVLGTSNTIQSGDTFAPGDNRIPTILGSRKKNKKTKPIRRNLANALIITLCLLTQPFIDAQTLVLNKEPLILEQDSILSFDRIILTPNGSNTIDFNFTNTFISTDNLKFTNDSKFTIVNYNYSSTNPNSSRLMVEHLSDYQLSLITINGEQAVYLTDTNILVPASAIPEPSTYGLIFGLATIIPYCYRKWKSKQTILSTV